MINKAAFVALAAFPTVATAEAASLADFIQTTRQQITATGVIGFDYEGRCWFSPDDAGGVFRCDLATDAA